MRRAGGDNEKRRRADRPKQRFSRTAERRGKPKGDDMRGAPGSVVVERSSGREAKRGPVDPYEGSPGRIHTPRLPPLDIKAERSARASLTVLTGLTAGRSIAVGAQPVTIGRAADADLVVDEYGISRHHARVKLMASGAFYVEDLGSTNGTFVGVRRLETGEPLHPGDLLRLGPELRMRFALGDSAEVALHRELYESSVRDPLTHAFNRKYLHDRLLAELARVRRAGGDVAALMIDLDSLKTLNDSFGHLAGDRALCAVAARIVRALRAEDALARYGGDEFVVVAVGTDGAQCEQLAERVRRAVAGLHLSARGHNVRITASIGSASLAEVCSREEPVGALLALADARMYKAKASGKNKVCTTGAANESLLAVR